MSRLRAARLRVPASTSNLGAGFDCVGIAIDRYLDVSFEPAPGGFRLEREGTLAALRIQPEEDAIARAFRSVLERRGVEVSGVLHATSTIPIGRGLGSSAAATVAGLALGAVVQGLSVLRDVELVIATEIEGHPDNAAPALYGGLVGVTTEAGRPRAFPLPLSDRIGFAFAAPAVEVSTRAAREALPGEVPFATAVRALSRVVALTRGLATGDVELLRIAFEDELHVPYRLPLIPHAAEAIAAATDAGAWAVTISGSGSGLLAVGPRNRTAPIARAMGNAFGSEQDGAIAFAANADPSGARGLPL